MIKMNKRIIGIVGICVVMLTSLTACGKEKEVVPETTAVTTVSDVVETVDIAPFSLLDVPADKIICSLYAKQADGTEVVYTMFNMDQPMVALIELSGEENKGTVYCGTYESREDFDDIGEPMIYIMLNNMYDGQKREIGYSNTESNCKLCVDETYLDAEKLSVDDTLTYMAVVSSLLDFEVAADDAEVAPDSASTTYDILSVTPEMIDKGIYAVDDVYNEYILGLFTDEQGMYRAAYSAITTDGTGVFVSGVCAVEPEEDEAGNSWTRLIIVDDYTGEVITCSYSEREDGTCYIKNGDVEIRGDFITAEETVSYMGLGLSFVEQE